MPRRGRSLRTIRTVKPKFKWSPIFANETQPIQATPATNHTEISYTLAKNATTNEHVVPPVLKIRHVKTKIIVPAVAIDEINCHTDYKAYILFVPQSHAVTYETPSQHPEWVMATTTFGLQHTSTTSISMSSPVSRNLNTGDSIILLLSRHNHATNVAASTFSITLSYTYVARTN